MNSLYDITNRFVDLMNKTENEDLTEEEYNQLGQELSLELKNKSTSIIGYIQNNESLINAIKDEEERLSEMRKTAEKKMERFKQCVKENMERLGIIEINTSLGILKIAKNPISIDIINEYEVPNEFKTEVVTTKIDKTKIKDNFKATGEIPAGIRINTQNTSLRVK